VQTVNLTPATEDDLVIDVLSSGISTGTEKMLWNGTMPAFPGLAYPLHTHQRLLDVGGGDCLEPVRQLWLFLNLE